MERVKSIAVTGKGGAGKIMIASLMIKILAESAKGKILAIDADSAMSLPYTLGMKVEKTVSELRKGVIGSKQLKKQMENDSMRAFMHGGISLGKGFDLLAMGRPEEPGCFCAVNDMLRYGIDTLIGDYDISIIDGEAGPEKLNRRVLKNIDVLLVVADMSLRNLKAGEDGVQVKRVGLVLNRIRGDRPAEEMLEKIGLDVWGCVPDDDTINQYDRDGRPLLELPTDSPCCAAVRQILEQVIPDMI